MSIWESISIPEPGKFSLRLIKAMKYGNWSWVKESDGNVGISLELEKEYDVRSLVSSKYFSIKNKNIHGLGHILTVICQDKEFYEIFEVLCQDLVDSSAAAEGQLEAISLLKVRLNSWTQLFKSFKGMGKKEVYGLAAEISFLSHWISLGQDLKCWTGPEGSPQDFINEKIKKAVEIKATSSDFTAVRISSLEQLDFNGTLHLCVFPITACDSSSHNAKTITSLVRNLQSNLDETSLAIFRKKLMLSGYSEDNDLDGYTFEIGEPLFYKVGMGFPRLIKANIAIEISNCSYDINLNKCTNFLIDRSDFFTEYN